MATSENFETASRRARAMQATFHKAVAARYDRKRDRVVIQLSSNLDVGFSPHHTQGLENAKPSQLEEIQISPSGFGLHFPRLDADIYLPGLLEGLFGSKKWMAARLGRLGGQSRSRAKTAAAKANGKLGGRPKKDRRHLVGA